MTGDKGGGVAPWDKITFCISSGTEAVEVWMLMGETEFRIGLVLDWLKSMAGSWGEVGF